MATRTQIIELSRTKSTTTTAKNKLVQNVNSVDTSYNSVWSNALNDLQIPAGSTISLHQAFVDEGKPFPYGSIELETDVEVALGFIYWLTDSDNGVTAGKTYSANVPVGSPGKGYIWIPSRYTSGANTFQETLQGNVIFTIPKGIYDPNFLGQVITDNLSDRSVKLYRFNDSPWLYGNHNPLLQNTIDDHIYTVVQADSALPHTIYEVTFKGVTLDSSLIAEFGDNKKFFLAYEVGGKYVPFAQYTIDEGISVGNPTFCFDPHINTDADPKNIRVYADDGKVHDEIAFFPAGIKKPPATTGQTIRFTNGNTYYGASQSSMIFENNRFKFNFLHSPYYIDAQGTAGIRVDNTLNTNTVVLASGGIAFTSMEPASFWEDTLGFDISNMTAAISDYEDTAGTIQFGKTVTGAYLGNAGLTAQTLIDQLIVPAGLYYTSTTQTIGLEADSENAGSNSKGPGFYYLDSYYSIYIENKISI